MKQITLALAAAVVACGGPGARRPPSEVAPVVTGADLETRPNEPIEKVLQDKVPGLLITRSGDGDLAVVIRGVATFDGADANPLYVLDDLPFRPGPGGALTGIDPQNIESIKLLKGSAAAIYGIQGANGVIKITTKKAGKKTP